MHARRNVDVIADHIVVSDCAGRVENDIGANYSAGTNNHTSANHRAGADSNIRRNHRLGVSGNNKALALPTQSIEHGSTRIVIANRNHDTLMRNPGDLIQ